MVNAGTADCGSDTERYAIQLSPSLCLLKQLYHSSYNIVEGGIFVVNIYIWKYWVFVSGFLTKIGLDWSSDPFALPGFGKAQIVSCTKILANENENCSQKGQVLKCVVGYSPRKYYHAIAFCQSSDSSGWGESDNGWKLNYYLVSLERHLAKTVLPACCSEEIVALGTRRAGHSKSLSHDLAVGSCISTLPETARALCTDWHLH